MTDAKHTPSGDTSFRASLLRNVGGGLVLILSVAGLFWLIGQFGGGTPTVSDLQTAQSPMPQAAVSPTLGGTPSPAASPLAPTPEPSPSPSPEDEPEPSPQPDPEPSPEPDERAPPEDRDPRAFPPSSVSVQVLDGARADGGAAARAVAEELRGQGYNVVAVNRAIQYEVTTVLWTPGFEAQARQVAADLGVTEVRQQPGNLSDQVQVHVVVGADRT